MTGPREWTTSNPVRALKVLDRRIFSANPCVRVPGEVVWRSSVAPSDDEILERGCIVRAPLDFLRIEDVETPPGILYLDSDWYVSAGAETMGSGRSVIHGDWQIKGIGRTVQAPLEGNRRQTTGFIDAGAAFNEIVCGQVLSKILSTPLLQPVAAILPQSPAHPPGYVLLVRDGVPIRVAHLALAAGSTLRIPSVGRAIAWRRFVSLAMRGEDSFDLDDDFLHACFDEMVRLALTMVAESRLLGVLLYNWLDNADIRGHVFDFEVVRFVFGLDLEWPEGRALHIREDEGGRLESPTEYLSRNDFRPKTGPNVNPVQCSLLSLQNAFMTIDLLGQGMGYQGVPSHRYSWRRLEALYAVALGAAAAALCGLKEPARISTSRKVTSALVAAVPLATNRGIPRFNTRVLLEEFIRSCRNEPTSTGAEASVAKLLASSLGPSDDRERVAQRAERLRSSLDGPSLQGIGRRIEDDANAIATDRQPDTSTRLRDLRCLLTDFESKLSTLTLPHSRE